MTISTITIDNTLEVEIDGGMLAAVLERCSLHIPQAEAIKVFPDSRKESGWLEYLIQLTYRGGGGLTIGAIQRTLGGSYEFHT